MAFLNKQERDTLKNDLQNMGFDKAKFRLHHMDPDSRLVFFRNVQKVGQWMTRFNLPGLGIQVTLIEAQTTQNDHQKIKSHYDLLDVVVEATANNHR